MSKIKNKKDIKIVNYIFMSLTATLLLSVCLINSSLANLTMNPNLNLKIKQVFSSLQQSLTPAKNFADQGKLDEAEAAFEKFEEKWMEEEDIIRETSLASYKAIENSMSEVKFAYMADQVKKEEVVKAILTLEKQLSSQSDSLLSQHTSASAHASATAANSVVLATSEKVNLQILYERVEKAKAALQNESEKVALKEMEEFQKDWPEVEGIVAAKSQKSYQRIEENTTKALGYLKKNPPSPEKSLAAMEELLGDLSPYKDEKVSYTMFDAMVIILREGLEALLILAALLSYFRKTGNQDKERWPWIGAGVGVLLSILTGVAIRLLFSHWFSGSDRELVEGVVGLLAAVMLIYVSFWLHRNSSLKAWQDYIKNKAETALNANNVFSLSFIAFLAVFREGAETVLFYLGMMNAISAKDLVSGLGLGIILLTIIGWAILKIGLKIPLKQYFLFTSVFIYYMAFKFIGSGIHALQISQIISATPVVSFLSFSSLGIYPTLETCLVQGLLLLGTLIVLKMRPLYS